MDEQEMNKRLMTANDALLKAYESLDPEAEDYKEKLEAIAKLHKEIAADAARDDELKAKEIDQTIEQDKLEEEKRANRKRETLDVIGKVIVVGTTLFTGISQIAMFWRSSKREDGDEKHDGKPYLTQTDKTVVQEGLRGGFWKNLPKF